MKIQKNRKIPRISKISKNLKKSNNFIIYKNSLSLPFKILSHKICNQSNSTNVFDQLNNKFRSFVRKNIKINILESFLLLDRAIQKMFFSEKNTVKVRNLSEFFEILIIWLNISLFKVFRKFSKFFEKFPYFQNFLKFSYIFDQLSHFSGLY